MKAAPARRPSVLQLLSCQRDLDIIPLSLGFDAENFEATSKHSCIDLE